MQSALVFFAALVACASSAPYALLPSAFLQAGQAPYIARLLLQPQNALAAPVIPEVDAVTASVAAPIQIRIAGQPHPVYTAVSPVNEDVYDQISAPAIVTKDASAYPQSPAFDRRMAAFTPAPAGLLPVPKHAGYPIQAIGAYAPADTFFSQDPAHDTPAAARFLTGVAPPPVGFAPSPKYAGYPVPVIKAYTPADDILAQGPAQATPALTKVLAAALTPAAIAPAAKHAGYPVKAIETYAPADAVIAQVPYQANPAHVYPAIAKLLAAGAPAEFSSMPVIDASAPAEVVFTQGPAQASPVHAKHLGAGIHVPAEIAPVPKYPVPTIETYIPFEAIFAQGPAQASPVQASQALAKYLAAFASAPAVFAKHAGHPVQDIETYAPADTFFTQGPAQPSPAQAIPALGKYLAAGTPAVAEYAPISKHSSVPSIQAYAPADAIFSQDPAPVQGHSALAKLVATGVPQQHAYPLPVEATFSIEK